MDSWRAEQARQRANAWCPPRPILIPAATPWAELLRLVGAVRRLAFDRTLPPSKALGRIRDAFADYDSA